MPNNILLSKCNICLLRRQRKALDQFGRCKKCSRKGLIAQDAYNKEIKKKPKRLLQLDNARKNKRKR